MYSDMPFMMGFGILIYLLIIAVGFFVTYWIIRLAVFHAMKAHTRWLQRGQG